MPRLTAVKDAPRTAPAPGVEFVLSVPLDLMNAMYFVRRRFYALKEVQPQAKPTTGSKRRKESKHSEAARAKTKIRRNGTYED